MTGWLIGLSYLAGWCYSTWRIGGALAWDLSYGDPDSGDFVMGALIGGIIAMIWPVSLAVCILIESEHKNGIPKLMHVPRKYKLRMQKQELLEKQLRIETLERELGLDNKTKVRSPYGS